MKAPARLSFCDAARLTGVCAAMHAPLTNTSNRIRLSSDTRYQLASDPVDTRHMSTAQWPMPDEFERQQGQKTMRQACQEWGISEMLPPWRR